MTMADRRGRGPGSAYRAGRLLARLIAALGWIIVGLAILGLAGFVISYFVYSSAGGDGGPYQGAMLASGIASGLAVIVAGLVVVAIGQMLRATLDTADNTRQMLAIM